MADDRVIGEGKNVGARDADEAGKEGVISEDEEERGEGATLFDSPVDVDRGFGAAAQSGADLYLVHETFYKVDHPNGHTDFGKNVEEEGVVYRVKGFCRVDEKEKVLLLFEEGCVEHICDTFYVCVAFSPVYKTFLAKFSYIIDGGHDGAGDGSSYDAVVEVVHGDGACA